MPIVRPRSEAVSGKRRPQPPPGAQVALGLRQPAHRHDRQRHGDVGDLVVEHARRVGDDDRRARPPTSRRYGRSRRRSWRRFRACGSRRMKAASTGTVRARGDAIARDSARIRRATPRGLASSHRRCSGSRSAMRSATRPMPARRHQNVEGLHRRPAFPTFAPPLDMAHRARHAQPRTARHTARRRPLVRRLMLRDFRSYAALDLAIEGRLVVLCGENGAGKTNLLEALSLLAPGRGLRRAELAECARRGGAGGFALSVEVEEEGETRQLGIGLVAAGMARAAPSGRTGSTARPSRRRAPSRDHVRVVWLTPAMDSLFSGPASERRRFLDRFVLAIDPAPWRASRASSSARCAAATGCSRKVRATPPGSTRSSARRRSSASRSPRRGSSALAGSRR